MRDVDLALQYHRNQAEIFFSSNERWKIIAKGRRFGLTRGFAHYAIENMVEHRGHKVLWVDTVNANIDRYIERYFMPALTPLRGYYEWRQQKKELTIFDSIIDMRSVDRPENIEGFGYDLIIVNEAGIVLKDRYLWNNTILPMTMDYRANVLAGGTPKGKRDKKSPGEKHLFYELYIKGQQKQDWRSFQYTSYDNPFLSPQDVAELAAEVPPSVRRQEIEGEFVDVSEHPIFDSSWWRKYDRQPDGFYRIIDSWDTGYKTREENSMSAVTTWGVLGNRYYLLDWKATHLEYPELKLMVMHHAEDYKATTVLIEDKASGQSLIQELQRGGLRAALVAVRALKDKVERAHISTSPIAEGRVFLPADAGWLEEYIDTMTDFPQGVEDDTVDSTSQALTYLEANQGSVEYHSVSKSDAHSLEDEKRRGFDDY